MRFHLQLFISCLIHSLSFTLYPQNPKDTHVSDDRKYFNTSFTCFMQVYLNIISFEINILILILISILSNLMISFPENIITKQKLFRRLSYLICWAFPMITNIFIVGFTQLTVTENTNFC